MHCWSIQLNKIIVVKQTPQDFFYDIRLQRKKNIGILENSRGRTDEPYYNFVRRDLSNKIILQFADIFRGIMKQSTFQK